MRNLYQVLIVDDEWYAIDGVIRSQDWESLGLSPPLTANNIRRAREILESQRVDILFCDIEMPHGSGVELMDWTRERGLDVIIVVFTCHADFTYARSAINVQAMDYLVKPVYSAQVRAVLQRAVQKLEDWERHSRILAKGEAADVADAWRSLLEGGEAESQPDPARLREQFPGWREGARHLLLLVRSSGGEEAQALAERAGRALEAGFPGCSIQANLPREGGACLLVAGLEAGDLPPKAIAPVLEELLEAEADRRSLCFVGIPAELPGLGGIARELLKLDRNTVLHTRRVYLLEEAATPAGDASLEGAMESWPELLALCDGERLRREVRAHLRRICASQDMDLSLLEKWIQNFMQVVYGVLGGMNLQAHTIFDRDDILDFFRPVRSVEEMEARADSIIGRTVQVIQNSRKDKGLSGRIKAYIDGNLTAGITRNDIADYFFLSPDHLSRIFKKQYGQSISDYMVSRRIELSKSLLADTDVPISEIAGMVGYGNYSHFSKMFKTATNLRPVDYRRISRQGTT